MKFIEFLRKNIVLFDGAMGTQIQNKGLVIGDVPEAFNINDRASLKSIHEAYVKAGADVISSNTFGASPYKLKDTNYSVQEVIENGLEVAKASGAKYVALDLGPVGKMMQPIGEMTFDEAYEAYQTQVNYGKSADVVLIETLSDLNEARAAVLAVKENSDLPVIVSMTFQEDGRTLTGVTPESFVHSMEALSVDGLGVNCSLGPDALLSIVKRIVAVSSVPVIVQANAGLPEVVNSETVFSFSPEKYQHYAKTFLELGVQIIGGCCGTGPEHINMISSLIEESSLRVSKPKKKHVLCSQTQVVNFDEFTIIGERINPTGNKKLKVSLRNGRLDDCIKEGISQVENGAQILDVNVGLPDIDELEIMTQLIDELSGIVEVPLQIDSSKSKVLEAGLRRFPGVGIVNSLNGKQKSMDRIFPIVKKYGAMVVCLTLDENGIPSSAEERVKIADKIIEEAKKYGVAEERLIIDCLVLTVSAQQAEVLETLKAITIIQSKYKVKTTLGISNVSYGMPNRKLLTRTFMTLALASGLKSAIMDPLDVELKNCVLASQVLLNIDSGGEVYIEKVAELDEKTVVLENDLYHMVLKGYKDEVKHWTELNLKSSSALVIVNEHLIPTLDEIGLKFEKKELFLPQLIRAAETIGVAFDVIKSELKSSAQHVSKGKIIMATVKGDVHDIGKNLVKILLENYGYDIIDLGKDVSPETILEATLKHDVKLVGLSALMTTTVISMAETIELLHKNCPETEIFVGGAVLTKEYAKSIQADYYCKDAKASVEVAQNFFKIT